MTFENKLCVKHIGWRDHAHKKTGHQGRFSFVFVALLRNVRLDLIGAGRGNRTLN